MWSKMFISGYDYGTGVFTKVKTGNIASIQDEVA